MSYFLADANGYVIDFANAKRMRELSKWAAARQGVIKRFVTHGFTGSPEGLAEEVDQQLHTAPAELLSLLETLRTAAKKADEILIIAEADAA